MTLVKEIKQILNREDKENLIIELKSSRILNNPKKKEKICKEIVALANRYGGKLILGLNDDGSYDGKNIFEDIDELKGKIDNWCRTSISPPIVCEIEFLSSNEEEALDGDIIVINVPKRDNIPHAVVEGNGANISSRKYFIRTSHGSKPVSDLQLEWLFNNQNDPEFSYKSRIVLDLNKENLQPHINPAIDFQMPKYMWDFVPFINALSNENLKELNKDIDKVQQFFVELCPYAFINSFFQKFMSSWLIDETRFKNRVTWSSRNVNNNSVELSLEELPLPNKGNLIFSLFSDFYSILKNAVSPKVTLPKNSSLEIEVEENKSRLILKNEDFTFTWNFILSSWRAGLNNLNLLNNLYSCCDSTEEKVKLQNQLMERFQSVEIDITYNTDFNFPERNVKFFKNYFEFAKLIENLIRYKWDYDYYIDNIPHYKKLYTLDFKIDKIINSID